MNHPTRICLSLLLAGGMTATSPAQETPPIPEPEVTERSPKELDDLLGAIALYPDDLVAIILPAAAQPADIVLAARYLENDGAMDKLDEQHWDESVRALAHFPDVVEWMNKNLAWTQAVGDAFALQPAAVMQSIQRLRAKAYAAGTLRDTEQQKVLVDGSVIRIVSAKEDVIYVPRYRSEVVYVDRPVYYTEPWITFGIGWAIGSWYHWGCDWNTYSVWVYDHHDHWHNHHSYYYYGGYYNYGHYHDNGHHYNNGDHYNHGHAWTSPRSHAHYGYHGGGRDDYHSRATYRPGPYVENESRHRNWNRGGNSNGDNPGHYDGGTGDGQGHDGHGNNYTNNPNSPERRAVRPPSNRGTPSGDRNPSVVVHNDSTPDNTAAPVVGDSGGRNGRNRGDTFNRGNGSDSPAGNNSRRPRSPSPGNASGPAVVAGPESPPPVVTTTSSRSSGRSHATVDDRPDYTQRSRRETGGNSGTNRTVRAYAPERTPPPANPTASRESRSDSPRSPAPSSRRYNDSSTASNDTTPATTSSSGRYHGGGGGGDGSGRSSSSSSSSSSDSGRYHGSNSSRSNDSGSSDGGNNGGHSGSRSGGSGRGR